MTRHWLGVLLHLSCDIICMPSLEAVLWSFHPVNVFICSVERERESDSILDKTWVTFDPVFERWDTEGLWKYSELCIDTTSALNKVVTSYFSPCCGVFIWGPENPTGIKPNPRVIIMSCCPKPNANNYLLLSLSSTQQKHRTGCIYSIFKVVCCIQELWVMGPWVHCDCEDDKLNMIIFHIFNRKSCLYLIQRFFSQWIQSKNLNFTI